jgi:5'(3')-deoxyribonucleotidase
MKPSLLCDVDGCTADLVGGMSKWLHHQFGFQFDPGEVIYHDRMGRSPKLLDLNEELARWFPGDGDGDNRGFGGAFTCFMRDPNVYTRWIDPVVGSVDAIAHIRQRYDVVFVTALMKGARDHFRSKMEWIERWFPEVPIMTSPSGQKFRVRGTFAVDDRYDTCDRWNRNGTPALLFKQSWNEIPPGVVVTRHDWASIVGVMDRTQFGF